MKLTLIITKIYEDGSAVAEPANTNTDKAFGELDLQPGDELVIREEDIRQGQPLPVEIKRFDI